MSSLWQRLRGPVVSAVLILPLMWLAVWLLGGLLFPGVWLVNGLRVPVQIEIAARRHTVPASGQRRVRVWRGAHRVRAFVGDRVVDETPLVVTDGASTVVYNVLGAAPVYSQPIYYTSGSARPPADAAFTFHAGARVVVHPSIDHAFETPPRSISMSQGTSVSVRWHLDVAQGGWPTSVAHLASTQADADALRLCRAVARAQPEDKDAAECIEAQLTRVRGLEAALNLSRAQVQAHPAEVVPHRHYQHWARLLDRSGSARQRYRLAYDADPSPFNTTMLARTEPPEVAIPMLRQVVAADSTGLARRSLAYTLFRQGDHAAALALFEEIAAADPEYRDYAEDHSRALVAAGRPAEAATRLAALAAKRENVSWRSAVAYALVARLPGVSAPKPPAALINTIGSGANAAFGRWMWTLVPGGAPAPPPAAANEDGVLDVAARIQRLAAVDPGAAWEPCRKAPPAARHQIAAPVALLLAAEYDRVGDVALADVLFETAAFSASVSVPSMRRYVHEGAVAADLWRLDPELRAALDLVRARRVEVEGGDAAALYAAARRGDILRGIVHHAADHWPRPKPGAADAIVVSRAPI